MEKSRIIEDLESIKQFFMDENNAAYPLALEEAINIIRGLIDENRT